MSSEESANAREVLRRTVVVHVGARAMRFAWAIGVPQVVSSCVTFRRVTGEDGGVRADAVVGEPAGGDATSRTVWPLCRGGFNLGDHSQQQVCEAMCHLLRHAVDTCLTGSDHCADVTLALCMPDTWTRREILDVCDIALRRVDKVTRLLLLPVSTCAVVAHGRTSACVAHIGHSVTTVTCVHDLLPLPSTRVALKHCTHTWLHALQSHLGLPDRVEPELATALQRSLVLPPPPLLQAAAAQALKVRRYKQIYGYLPRDDDFDEDEDMDEAVTKELRNRVAVGDVEIVLPGRRKVRIAADVRLCASELFVADPKAAKAPNAAAEKQARARARADQCGISVYAANNVDFMKNATWLKAPPESPAAAMSDLPAECLEPASQPLHLAIKEALDALPPTAAKAVSNTLLLSGSGTAVQGLTSRLETELSALYPLMSDTEEAARRLPSVLSDAQLSQTPSLVPWHGMQQFVAATCLQQDTLCVTREEWHQSNSARAMSPEALLRTRVPFFFDSAYGSAESREMHAWVSVRGREASAFHAGE